MMPNNISVFKTAFYFVLCFVLSLISYVFAGQNPSVKNERIQQLVQNQSIEFLENKGQMSDMNGKPLPFVLFKAEAPGMNVYITEQGLTYVFIKTAEEEEEEEEDYDGTSTENAMPKSVKRALTSESRNKTENSTTEMAWVNMYLKGASIKNENIIKEGESAEHFNYFLAHCPEGIYNVKQYEKITITNVYPGIDWVFYNSSNAGMKYDFTVHPGADPAQIKLIYESENPLTIDRNGNINIKTQLGTLAENAPYSYLQETNTQVRSYFKKTVIDKHNMEVRFQFSTLNFKHETLIIDPQLVWGTLYGGNLDEGFQNLTVDKNNNLFVGGYSRSTNFPVQTAGTFFQGALAGNYDACIIKFDNAGNRLWATYYGGSTGNDGILALATDGNNNLFAGGYVQSTNFPLQTATTFFQGAHGGGGNDGFILKFDNSGNRLWATYYGGAGDDRVNSLSVNSNNDLFAGGATSSTNFPVQSAATFFQGANGGSNDGFILKFDNTGNRLWATYYGGSDNDRIYSLAIDGNNNVFAGGSSRSLNFPVQSAATFFQGVYAGGGFSFGGTSGDAFILKFDNAGNRFWATYYGGSGNEALHSLATDGNNNLFAVGITESTNFPVQTVATFFQGANAGGGDAFILKFDNAGNRLWASYYGGSAGETMSEYDDIAIDACGNVYLGFMTKSSNVPLLNPGCGFFDGTYGGGSAGNGDSFIAKFTNGGTLLWSSYIGGTGDEYRTSLAVDNNNNLFTCGEFISYTAITVTTLPLINPGGGAFFNNAPNGGDDSYILKFIPDEPSNIISQVNATGCSPCNGSATITLSCSESNYNYVWSNGSSTLNSTNATNTITGLCPGTYTVTATSNCNQSQTATFIITGATCGITVNVNSAAICSGATPCPTLTANGSSGTVPYTYLWNTGATSPNINPCPSTTTTYTVTVTDTGGNTATSTAVVTINPPVSVNTTATNISCSGASTGSATAAGGSGSSPYTYSWSGGVPGSGFQVSGLSAGTYTVTVTDGKGCTATSTAAITSPQPLSGLFTKGTASCTGCGCKEWIIVNATGGTNPYTYIWPDGYVNRYKNQLCPGGYSINIKDKNGCSVNVSLTAP